MPTNCAPSPPICVMPVISPLPSGLSRTIVWQPMPTPSSVPSGLAVERVVRAAGAEERRAGEAAGAAVDRRAPLGDGVRADVDRVDATEVLEPRGDGQRDQVGVELGLGGNQRAVLLVALADDPRRVGRAVERVAQRGLEVGELLLDDEDLVEAAGERAERLAVVRVEHPDLHEPDAGALEVALLEAELAQRLQQLVVGLAGGDDAQPGVARGQAHRVELVQRAVAAGDLQPRAEQRALELERLRARAGGRRAGGGRAGPPTRRSG